MYEKYQSTGGSEHRIAVQCPSRSDDVFIGLMTSVGASVGGAHISTHDAYALAADLQKEAQRADEMSVPAPTEEERLRERLKRLYTTVNDAFYVARSGGGTEKVLSKILDADDAKIEMKSLGLKIECPPWLSLTKIGKDDPDTVR